MRVAQRLYEGVDIGGETVGLITYMRTDGVQIAGEAIDAARRVIETDYGRDYVPPAPRRYETKAKNAQEAHEAIRPTDLACRPRETKHFLDADQAKLYELIWLRTVASQMESAELERTTVDITANVAGRLLELRATGTVVKFDGFLALYQEGRDEDPDDEEARRLPQMSAGEALSKRSIAADQHFTEPPPRYSEASLVKRLEELGIGRPSTYASILQVLKDRKYVRLDKRRLIPEDRGRIVVAFLESFFARYVEYDFTAGLEEQLDLISNSEVAWREVLRDFWREFIGAIDETKDLKISEVIDALDALLGAASVSAARGWQRSARLPDLRQRPAVAQTEQIRRLHRLLELSGMPLYQAAVGGGAISAPRSSARIRQTGLDVTVRSGRFGPYLQLGETVKAAKSPSAPVCRRERRPTRSISTARWLCCRCRAKSAVIPRTASRSAPASAVSAPTCSTARPTPISDSPEEVFTVGLNRAVTLIAEKRAKALARASLRRRSGPRARRSSDQGRRDRGQEGPLRPLCQPRRRQCDAAGRQNVRDRHA